jgi:hypothetical protein
MGTKVRHWTGEHDSNGRQVYEEHQGRTQVYDTAEIWKAAVHSDTYRKWQYDKFMQTSPLVDSDGVMYSRSSHSPLKEKAVKNLSQTHLGPGDHGQRGSLLRYATVGAEAADNHTALRDSRGHRSSSVACSSPRSTKSIYSTCTMWRYGKR